MTWLLSTLVAPVCAQESASRIKPPRLAAPLPELQLPQDVSLPDSGTIDAIVTVATDGSAIVADCNATQAACEAVAQAISAARFEPATRDDIPIASNVRIALRAARPPPAAAEPEPGVQQPPAGAAPDPTAPQPSAAPVLDYGARGRTRKPPPGARRLELEEMRNLPGAFGDPYRAVDALPGVVPVLSGLPYFFIRGSPPAGTQYLYDDIPVPALYHLAIGPAAIHPRMVGPITLYSGVAPARYGRLTGGVIGGEGPPTGDGRTHVESELRLLDVSAYLQAPVLGGTLTAAARYGYPALLLSVFSPNVQLAYWDYQLRYGADLSPSEHVELVALGSHDALGVNDSPGDAIALTYHRIEARYLHHTPGQQLGAALLFGWEHSELGSQFQLQATRVGPRLWYQRELGSGSRLRLSADMQAILGHFGSVSEVGDLNRNTSDVGLVGDVRSRSVWGAQLELTLRPWKLLELQLGGRADAWLQSGGAQAVLDPRVRVILHPSDTLDLHLAAGVAHQPAVFFVPLPGIADLPTDQGLQAALQSEAGVGWDTPLGLRAELQAFVHRYQNLVFTDTLLLQNTLERVCSPRGPIALDCGGTSAPERIDGYAYGAELFVRRPISERLSGFVSYTLAFSAVQRVVGLKYTPSWDVRHVANLVLQWQIGAGFSAGLRLFVRSAKSQGEFLLDPMRRLTRDEQRLPGFTRLDVEAAYSWLPSWGRMRIGLEWFNLGMAREPTSLDCSGDPRRCEPRYLPAIFFPNLSVRGEH